MKKALLALGIGIVSFLVGLLGFIFVLPSVAPGRAEEARLYLDSLEAARLSYFRKDSTLTTSTVQPVPETSQLPDTSRKESGTTSPPQAPDESTLLITALKDSLADFRRRIRALQAQNGTLQRQLEEARKAARPQPTPTRDVAGLTETLTKLDDKELRPILQQLDSDVLEQLYRNTSGRTQARLLQAMPADRAALFVQSLVRGTSVPPSSAQGTGESSSGASAQ